MFSKEDLSGLDDDFVLDVVGLRIKGGPFKRSKIRSELKYAGFDFKEYKNWWGSEFKILGEYEVEKLRQLFAWLDGLTDIIHDGKVDPTSTAIVKPRF